jgi:hypothetical protein
VQNKAQTRSNTMLTLLQERILDILNSTRTRSEPFLPSEGRGTGLMRHGQSLSILPINNLLGYV